MSAPPRYNRRLARRFFIALLLLSGAAFVYTLRGFLIPILLSTVFTTLFYPLYLRLLRAVRGRKGLASGLTCAVLVFLILGPLWSIGTLVASEAVDLYANARQEVQSLLDRRESLIHDLEQTPWFQGLGLSSVDWAQKAEEVAQGTAGFLATVLNKTAGGTLHAVVVIGVMLFSMFYFFADGDRIVARIKYLSPLAERDENEIFRRFASTARATVRGTVVIAMLQGLLGGITLAICGVGAPILWGVVMTVLAFIPIIGVKLVLVPAGLFQILVGNVWQGVAILVVSFVVILNVDNLLRPRLVGSGAQMHDLLIFFATLGGLGTFGIAGLIVGPVLAAFVMSLLEIYAVEFRHELEPEEPAPPQVSQASPSSATPPGGA